MAHRRDDDRVGALDLARDAPADPSGQVDERAGGRTVADDGEQRGEKLRLHEHLDGTLGDAPPVAGTDADNLASLEELGAKLAKFELSGAA